MEIKLNRQEVESIVRDFLLQNTEFVNKHEMTFYTTISSEGIKITLYKEQIDE